MDGVMRNEIKENQNFIFNLKEIFDDFNSIKWAPTDLQAKANMIRKMSEVNRVPSGKMKVSKSM
eukprot:NODE_639_length_1471_cov_405.745429_g480_i0.p2 GENE.NODE_639_length_1471_cov_405.745429_g480_i0~~NODE_639_length_1471_cov_405.745429_g480_i0.p2  ORF type:complete len:64 (+),score=11.94 NODE_639_length_1471_cov_405.745429_g480_i0:964-1155(+)